MTVQKSIAELLTVISDQRIKYQFPDAWLDQIIDRYHNIYLNKKLSTKLLTEVDDKNVKSIFTKTGRLRGISWNLALPF